MNRLKTVDTRLRRHGHHLALVAIFLALGGTGYANSVARNSVGSQNVKNDSLTGADINEATLKLRTGQGSQGPQGPAGPQGPQGLQGVAGSARAYGRVSASGVITDSKNVIQNATGPTGVYCIALDDSIDGNTAVAVVSPDYSGDDTNKPPFSFVQYEAVVEWVQGRPDCLPGIHSIEVRTFVSVYDTDGSFHDDLTVENESFSFLVP